MANDSGYDSHNSDYTQDEDFSFAATIGGLIALAAFGTIGCVALFEDEAVVAGTVGEGVTTAAGNTYYGITLAEAEATDAAFAGGVLTQEGANLITGAAITGGVSNPLSAAGLIALYNFNVSQNPNRTNFFNLGGVHGTRLIEPGGAPLIPGFPGGGLVSHGWRRVCYTVFTTYDDEPQTVCYYEE